MEGARQHVNLEVPAQIMSQAEGAGIGELTIDLAWTVKDPFAISMVFSEHGEKVVWTASCDLFIAALVDKTNGWHGEGDISVQFHENVCYVSLHGDHERPAVIAKMSAVGLAPYIDRIARLRVVHSGLIAELIENELKELLEAA